MRSRILPSVALLLAAGGLFVLLGVGPDRDSDPVRREAEGGASDTPRTDGVTLEGRSDAARPGATDEAGVDAATSPPARLRDVEVTVRTADTKKPLAGARLRLFPPTTPPHGVPTRIVEVDAEGKARLSVEDGKPWYVEGGAEGYEPERLVLMTWGQGTVRSTLDLRPAGRVRGRVTREDDGPLQGLVWVVYAGGGTLRNFVETPRGPGPVRTAGDGSFEVRGVALGVSFALKAEAADGACGAAMAARLSTDAAERSDVRIGLAPRGNLRFRLLTPDGRPYRGGLLYLRPLAVQADESELDERSPGHDGRVLYEGLSAGCYRIAFHHDDLRWRPVTDAPIVVRPGATTDLGDLRLGTGLSVEGRIAIEDGDEADLQGLRLKLFDATRTFWTHTQEEGVFAFHDVEPGRFHLEIDSEAYRLRKACVVEAGADGLALGAVGASAGLVWSVVDTEGHPIPWFQTWVVDHGPPGSPSRQQYAGENGRLETDGLPPGAYDLMVEVEGARLWRSEAVHLERGETRRIDATLQPIQPVRRTVFGPDGKPLPYAAADLTYLADVPFGRPGESGVDMHYATAFADAEGVVTLAPGRPDLAVSFQAAGCAPVRYALDDLPAGPIRLEQGVVVTGHVRTTAGDAPGRVHLALDPAGRHVSFGRTTWTDAEGAFRLQDVGAGTWTLRAYSLRGDVILQEDVVVEAPTTDVGEIRLP